MAKNTEENRRARELLNDLPEIRKAASRALAATRLKKISADLAGEAPALLATVGGPNMHGRGRQRRSPISAQGATKTLDYEGPIAVPKRIEALMILIKDRRREYVMLNKQSGTDPSAFEVFIGVPEDVLVTLVGFDQLIGPILLIACTACSTIWNSGLGIPTLRENFGSEIVLTSRAAGSNSQLRGDWTLQPGAD